jgi:hypothetical protein
LCLAGWLAVAAIQPDSARAQISDQSFFKPYAHPLLSRYALVVGGGLSGYNGDVNRPADFRLQNNYLNPSLYLGLDFLATNHVSVRWQNTVGQLRGKARPGNWGDLSFRTRYVSSEIDLVLQAISEKRMEKEDLHWNPFVTAGVGALYYQVRTRIDSTLRAGLEGVTQRPKYPVTLIVPVGIGLAWRVNERAKVTLETVYGFTGTDFMDGASLRADPEPGKDNYFALSLKVSWRLYRRFHYKQYLKREHHF